MTNLVSALFGKLRRKRRNLHNQNGFPALRDRLLLPAEEERFSDLRQLIESCLRSYLEDKGLTVRVLGTDPCGVAFSSNDIRRAILVYCDKGHTDTIGEFLAQEHIQRELKGAGLPVLPFETFVSEQIRLVSSDSVGMDKTIFALDDRAEGLFSACGKSLKNKSSTGGYKYGRLSCVIDVTDADGTIATYGLAAGHFCVADSNITGSASSASSFSFSTSSLNQQQSVPVETQSLDARQTRSLSPLSSRLTSTSTCSDLASESHQGPQHTKTRADTPLDHRSVNSLSGWKRIGDVYQTSYGLDAACESTNNDWGLIRLDRPADGHAWQNTIPSWATPRARSKPASKVFALAATAAPSPTQRVGIVRGHTERDVTWGTVRSTQAKFLLGSSSKFTTVYSVTVDSPSEIVVGDSGSLVFSVGNFAVLGVVVAVDTFGNALVMPISTCLDSIQQTLRASRVALSNHLSDLVQMSSNLKYTHKSSHIRTIKEIWNKLLIPQTRKQTSARNSHITTLEEFSLSHDSTSLRGIQFHHNAETSPADDCIHSNMPSDFEAISVPPSLQGIGRASPIPRFLPSRLGFVRDEGSVFYHRELLSVQWQEPTTLEYCMRLLSRHAAQKSDLEGESAYISSQFVRILQYTSSVNLLPLDIAAINSSPDIHPQGATERELAVVDLTSFQALSEDLPMSLAQCLLTNKNSIIFLDFRAKYSTFRWLQGAEQNHIDAVCRTIEQKKTYNAEYEWFIPRSFIDNFFDETLVRYLTGAETSHDLNSRGNSDFDTFVNEICQFGVILLATCVYVTRDMQCFYRLWKAGIRDVDLPLTLNDPRDLWTKNSSERHAFWKGQYHFLAHRFPNSHGDAAVKPVPSIRQGAILPFLKKEELSDNGTSKVYKVRIHADHHSFSPDRSQLFALKVFRSSEGGNLDFTEESRIWKQLAELPHPHLTPRFASWEHKASIFTLLPLATKSLTTLLSEATPKLNDSFVTWLITQMSGLAAALDQIHSLGPAKLGPEYTKSSSFAGWHHDLKPANILVFDDNVLKISDFGTARIRQISSGSISAQSGLHKHECYESEGYDAPDDISVRSRPYDIWSLGCVFSEILVWTFSEGRHNVADFKSRRVAEDLSSIRKRPDHIASFWHYNYDDQAVLKPAVLAELEWLKSKARQKHIYQWLMLLVSRMLIIDAKRRPTSSQVHVELDHVLLQVKWDIKHARYDRSQPSTHSQQKTLVSEIPTMTETSDVEHKVAGTSTESSTDLQATEHSTTRKRSEFCASSNDFGQPVFGPQAPETPPSTPLLAPQQMSWTRTITS